MMEYSSHREEISTNHTLGETHLYKGFNRTQTIKNHLSLKTMGGAENERNHKCVKRVALILQSWALISPKGIYDNRTTLPLCIKIRQSQITNTLSR